MALTVDEEYKKALTLCTGILAVKIVVTTLATVRARLVSDNSYSLAEDNTAFMEFLYQYVFKAMFLVFPLGPKKEDKKKAASELRKSDPLEATDPTVVTLRALHRNATEQEPWFLAVAIAYAITVTGKTHLSIWLLYAYTAFRCLHWVSYFFGLQPWRSVFFILGTASTLMLSVKAIQSAM
eukprot:CAMPEP_0180781066 /NCGR_PEP_ID=MMETSP1038_2-20121128/47410_1 /TAXON_ID=632150 /ORGANISM="Azadinium spinosum, Strain 3D9" /LENGTH=180 /DNA_ID=CAMNT_0022816779 /DNA_START=6 /DNA_END=548 /DNA_ORIENTATION=+